MFGPAGLGRQPFDRQPSLKYGEATMIRSALSFLLVVLLAGLLLAACSRRADDGAAEKAPTTSGNKPAPASPAFRDGLGEMLARRQGPHRRKRPRPALLPDQEATLDEAFQVWGDVGAEEKVRLLDKASVIRHARIFDLVDRALDDPDAEVRRAGIEMIYDYDSPLILPLVRKALGDSDPATRVFALGALYYADDPGVSDLLARGLEDADEEVREQALGAAADQPEDIRHAAYAKALAGTYKDTKRRALARLEAEQTHGAVEVLLPVLKDKDPEVFGDAQMALEFWGFPVFESYQQAKSWWDKNKHNLDAELFEKEI